MIFTEQGNSNSDIQIFYNSIYDKLLQIKSDYKKKYNSQC